MDWIGKSVRIIKKDGDATVSKSGVVISVDSVFVQLRTQRGLEAIPVISILRMEVL